MGERIAVVLEEIRRGDDEQASAIENSWVQKQLLGACRALHVCMDRCMYR